MSQNLCISPRFCGIVSFSTSAQISFNQQPSNQGPLNQQAQADSWPAIPHVARAPSMFNFRLNLTSGHFQWRSLARSFRKSRTLTFQSARSRSSEQERTIMQMVVRTLKDRAPMMMLSRALAASMIMCIRTVRWLYIRIGLSTPIWPVSIQVCTCSWFESETSHITRTLHAECLHCLLGTTR